MSILLHQQRYTPRPRTTQLLSSLLHFVQSSATMAQCGIVAQHALLDWWRAQLLQHTDRSTASNSTTMPSTCEQAVWYLIECAKETTAQWWLVVAAVRPLLGLHACMLLEPHHSLPECHTAGHPWPCCLLSANVNLGQSTSTSTSADAEVVCWQSFAASTSRLAMHTQQH